MISKLLIPNQYKILGWTLFLIFATIGIVSNTFEFKIPLFEINSPMNESERGWFNDYNLTNEFAFFGTTVGLLMIVFAKEKIEDEYIAVLRLKVCSGPC